MKRLFLSLVPVLSLAACGQSSEPQRQIVQPAPVAQQVAAPAPVVVQSAPANSGMQDMITGAAIGALATHALSGSSKAAPSPAPVVVNNTHTRVVERTVIIKQEKPAPAPKVAAVPPTAPPRPAATTYIPPRTSYAPSAVVTPSYRPSPSRK